MNRRWNQTLILLTAIAADAAHAHSLSTSYGGLHIGRKSMVASINVSAVDVLHYAGRSPDDIVHLSIAEFRDLEKKCGWQIASEFIVRDADGKRFATPTLVASEDNLHIFPAFDQKTLSQGWVSFQFLYDLPIPPHYLTLQQNFFSTAPRHESQLSMHVKDPRFDTGSTHVVLTNRGNTETISIEWPVVSDPKAFVPPPRFTTPQKFSSVLANLWIDDGEIRLEIDIPLPLLETWKTIPRVAPDFITADEFASVIEIVRGIVEGKNQLKIDGQMSTPVLVASGLLGPDQSELPATPQKTRTFGYYISRAAVRLRYPLTTAPHDIEFTWELFNNAILDAEMELHVAEKSTANTLTKYAPSFRWRRH